ncbi:hypothetical protein LZ30DRAFT_321239 [Colletotrichum cereale]|nr:hypothetical protein LZ30DRAFT_321239 [Colletotrichum cereale]
MTLEFAFMSQPKLLGIQLISYSPLVRHRPLYHPLRHPQRTTTAKLRSVEIDPSQVLQDLTARSLAVSKRGQREDSSQLLSSERVYLRRLQWPFGRLHFGHVSPTHLAQRLPVPMTFQCCPWTSSDTCSVADTFAFVGVGFVDDASLEADLASALFGVLMCVVLTFLVASRACRDLGCPSLSLIHPSVRR